jgi:CheY-like chemotaxis protein
MASPGSVLLVDDDWEIRQAIRDVLADEGYETVEAAEGSAALDYLRTSPRPALILLDWNMAPMNGAQFLAELRKEPGLSTIPVVLLTADSRVNEHDPAFVGYLRKPIDLERLFAIVARYCADS